MDPKHSVIKGLHYTVKSLLEALSPVGRQKCRFFKQISQKIEPLIEILRFFLNLCKCAQYGLNSVEWVLEHCCFCFTMALVPQRSEIMLLASGLGQIHIMF